MMTGKATTVHVASPNANRRMTSSTVANVRPIGQTRQNTGKPKTSVEPNAAARMPWRLSILMPLALPQGEAHAEQGEATLPPLPSLSPLSPFFLPRDRKCTGHAQAQNTLPSTMHTSSTATTLTTAIGMAVRSAIMASSAPRGHSSVMDSKPMPQKLPMPPAVKYPTATTASSASMIRNRSR